MTGGLPAFVRSFQEVFADTGLCSHNEGCMMHSAKKDGNRGGARLGSRAQHCPKLTDATQHLCFMSDLDCHNTGESLSVLQYSTCELSVRL